jgi:hypothetical protein
MVMVSDDDDDDDYDGNAKKYDDHDNFDYDDDGRTCVRLPGPVLTCLPHRTPMPHSN